MTHASPAGFFGAFGGRFVAETLIAPLDELAAAWERLRDDAAFTAELAAELRDFAGRPTPLLRARGLERALFAAGPGAAAAAAAAPRIYLKREDLAHTGAHKINNAIGQALLARRIGKRRLIAETGAGQHGVATATVAARYGMPCTVYMGELDIARQAPNVGRMRLLGAEVRPVAAGTRTLKDAMNEALRDWVAQCADTHYLIGSAAGPHPYPSLVRRLQRVIGDEARAQLRAAEGRDPDAAIACVGGGSNAIGLFATFVDDPGPDASRVTQLFGVEAAGAGLDSGRHAATIARGSPGVLHGARSLLLQDADGQVLGTHSVSAGLDYPGVGPEHAHLAATGRARYLSATDAEALAACRTLAAAEGILPALESAHALAAIRAVAAVLARVRPGPAVLLVCLSGRGDKDLATLLEGTAP
jgi:tryptophan synthase beta chain